MQAKAFNIIPTTMLNRAFRFLQTPLSEKKALSIPKRNKTKAALDDYESLFTSQRNETREPIKLALVEGVMPEDFPTGVYYLIGPGVFTDDHGSTVHPLDGHGYLRAFEINGPNKEVKFSAKYVKTEAQMEEFDPVRRSWKFTHRGAFSVLKGGKIVGNTKVMKNVANTTVLKWGGRLFCLWEGGAPYEIHPSSLETLGRFDLINAHENGTPWTGHMLDVVAALLKPMLYGLFKMPKKRILSHYKIDVQRQRLIIMACNAEDMLLPRSHITFYEFDKNFKLVHKQEFHMSEQLMVHDWGFTDSHYVVFGNRVKLNFPGLVVASFGLSPMISALSPNSNKPTSPLYLIPRHGREEVITVELSSQLWLLHVANAMGDDEDKVDQGNRRLLIHAVACSYKWFSFQNMFGFECQSGKFDHSMMNKEDGPNMLPHLVQVSIELDGSGKCKNSFVEPLSFWKRPSDLPTINPRCQGSRHRYIYAATSSGSHQAFPNFPFDSIVKIDTHNRTPRPQPKVWSTIHGSFIGEPMFVPKPMSVSVSEDDGYLLVVEYAVSQGECYLVVIDAKKIEESTVARFAVPKYLTFPLGFHGLWDPVE